MFRQALCDVCDCVVYNATTEAKSRFSIALFLILLTHYFVLIQVITHNHYRTIQIDAHGTQIWFDYQCDGNKDDTIAGSTNG